VDQHAVTFVRVQVKKTLTVERENSMPAQFITDITAAITEPMRC
jgi:hypothetical protein